MNFYKQPKQEDKLTFVDLLGCLFIVLFIVACCLLPQMFLYN